MCVCVCVCLQAEDGDDDDVVHSWAKRTTRRILINDNKISIKIIRTRNLKVRVVGGGGREGGWRRVSSHLHAKCPKVHFHLTLFFFFRTDRTRRRHIHEDKSLKRANIHQRQQQHPPTPPNINPIHVENIHSSNEILEQTWG